MFVDASALCAMLASETDARLLATRLRRDATRITSPLAIWETVVTLTRIFGLPVGEVRGIVDRYLVVTGIEVRAVPPQAAALALQAFDRFGKGRHPARLNFGDCFAYACARCFGTTILCKGDGFPQTDIELA